MVESSSYWADLKRMVILYLLVGIVLVPWGTLYALLSTMGLGHWSIALVLLAGGLFSAHLIWRRFENHPEHGRGTPRPNSSTTSMVDPIVWQKPHDPAQKRIEMIPVEEHRQILQEEKLRALGALSSGIAHDFNNLLSIMVAQSSRLLSRAKDPDMRRELHVLLSTAMSASQVVRRVQEFARMRREPQNQPVDLNHIVREVLELLRYRSKDEAEARGVTYQVEEKLHEIPPTLGNPDELRQVLVNLVFNALDAMPQGGRLTMRTRAEANKIVCAVEDTGHGMTEAVMARIFEPFFTTKGEKGTGLGLTVSRATIERHKGAIRVQSQLGSGSSFEISLPVVLPATQPPEKDVPFGRRRHGNVLLIDDEPRFLGLIKDILADEGHTVVTCKDGSSGIARFVASRGDIDLVVTDLAMPNVSGWEVISQIKQRSPGTPVILLTGFPVDPEEAAARGADFLMGKPVLPEDLFRVISEGLEKMEPGAH